MKIGFIGAGSMGGAMIKGLLKAEAVKKEHLYVKGGSSGTAEALQKEWGFQLVTDYALFQECKVIFIATGAKVVLPVLQELAPHFSNESLLISVATGHTIEEAQMALGNKEAKVVHAIPNTPVSVNQGVIGVALAPTIEGQTKELVMELLATLGLVKEIREAQLETFGTVAGCSPAFVDIFMEALGDTAVLEGLPRDLSYEIVAQMIKGTATLALDTKKHPGALKDEVTSPGGSTIRGVVALEKNGFRYAVMDAVQQANHE